MKILVFGGTRYFGRAATELLLSQGHTVTIFSRGNTRPEFWGRIEHLQGDRTDAQGVFERLRGRTFDAVIDTQCFTREHALSAIDALHGSVGRYVVASTVSTYGAGGHAPRRATVLNPLTDREQYYVDYRYLQPVRESDSDVSNHPWEYRPYLNRYAEGKRHMERVMLESPVDWPYVVIRVPATLGPDDPTARFPWWLWRILDGEPVILPDGGKHSVQLGYSRDLARFIVDCLTAPSASRQVYNFAQRELPLWRDFLTLVADSAGRPLNAVAVPSTVLHLRSGLPWEDPTYAPFCEPIITMSLSKSERDVGSAYTPLAEWVKSTTDWYLANPSVLATTKHSDLRNAEISFARDWQANRASA